MRKEEPSNNVKLAATNALLNSLEFTKANFDKEVSACLFLVRTLLLGRPLWEEFNRSGVSASADQTLLRRRR